MTVPEPQQRAAGGEPLPPLDDEAFADRFRESCRALWLIAVGVLGDRHLAEDAVQEAAVIGLRKLNRFKPGTNFTAWMGQIVRHVALNHRRKHNRRRALSLDGEGGPELAQAGAHGVADEKPVVGARGGLPQDQHLFDDQLMSALKSIGEVARACLLLRTIEGLDYAEISQLLDIPQGTAMSHVYRTRRTLRRMLTDEPTTGVGPAEATS